MAKLSLDYSALPKLIGGVGMTHKQLSRQFLVWFLQNYYHLDETEAFDSVCDERYDKGVDGIYVDEQLRRIEIFSVCVATKEKSAGDVKLKEFVGGLVQFQSSNSVKQLAIDTLNIDLKRILTEMEIASRLEDGFQVHGVYITTATPDVETRQFLQHVTNVTFWDKVKLEREYVPLYKTPPIATPFVFDVKNVPSMEYQVDGNLKMVIAPVAASELVMLDGITNNELFSSNVRYWLGKNTSVNKDIAKSIQKKEEHKYFPAFHNGLIVLCGKLELKDQAITIVDYSVVNGCQSLRGLYENKQDITPELRILTKFFEVPEDSDLGVKITNRTNNQNGSKPRDFHL